MAKVNIELQAGVRADDPEVVALVKAIEGIKRSAKERLRGELFKRIPAFADFRLDDRDRLSGIALQFARDEIDAVIGELNDSAVIDSPCVLWWLQRCQERLR